MPKNPFSSYKEKNYSTLLCHVTELQGCSVKTTNVKIQQIPKIYLISFCKPLLLRPDRNTSYALIHQCVLYCADIQ